jgi:hypothetical protein
MQSNILKQSKTYFPLVFLMTWLLLTIIIFIWGPWNYKLINPFTFYFYLFLIHLALILGYMRGLESQGRSSRVGLDFFKWTKTAIIVSGIYFIFKSVITAGDSFSHFIGTFRNASETYTNSNLRHPTLFNYSDILFFPVFIFASVNTIYIHKKLNWWYRLVVYLMIIGTIAASIGSAVRGQIVDILIICFAAFWLSLYNKNLILKLYQKLLTTVFAVTILIAFLSYSNLLVTSRGGITSINLLTFEPPKKDYFLYEIIPSNLKPLINSTSFYTSHSYYQLNKALNLPSKGIALGLSNSYFVMDNIEQYTGWKWLKTISYGIRLDNEMGGGFGAYWSTFYTWIASDFTFPGTIIIIFLIGFLCSLALKDSLIALNPLAITSFCTLFHFIFQFAFNNPLQDGAGIMTHLVIPLVWLILRKPGKP